MQPHAGERYRIRSSRREIESFFKAGVWQDVQALMEEALALNINELLKDKDLYETAHLRGDSFRIRKVLQLKEDMLEQLEGDEEIDDGPDEE